MKITSSELNAVLDTLTNTTPFTLQFVKKDGTIRTYNHCLLDVHIPNPDRVRKGITQVEARQKYNNLVFFVDDENPEKPGQKIGFRTAKIENIVFIAREMSVAK